MAPIMLKSYTWSESDTSVLLKIPIPNVSTRNVDIFVTDRYIKISQAPYLWELFIKYSIDPVKSLGKVGNGNVEFTLIKTVPKMWLEIEESIPDDKSYKIERRKAEVDKNQKFHSEVKEKNAIKKQELNRTALEERMRKDKEEQERIRINKENDKMEVLRSFSLQSESSTESQAPANPREEQAIRNHGSIPVFFTPTTACPARQHTKL